MVVCLPAELMGHTPTSLSKIVFTTAETAETAHVSLSLLEHDALQTAFAVLLSPLDYVDSTVWRGEVGRAVRDLVGADRAVVIIDAPGIPLIYSEDYSQKILDAYAGYYREIDLTRIRRDELGLEVWNRSMLHSDMRAFRASEIHRDFLVPNGILDAMGITVPVPGTLKQATIFLHGTRPGTLAFGDRGLQLLSLLVPAFKAGLRDLLHYELQRASLSEHLDSLSDGLRICDLNGRILHQNPAFSAQLAEDHDTQIIQKAIEEVVHPLVMFSRERAGNPWALAGRRASVKVHTNHASYEIRGSFLGRALPGAEASISILIRRLAPNTSMSDRTLHERYKLTNREIEITRILAQGRSTKEIAAQCGISLHTARRHTEKIFTKLGVRTRSQIAPKLRAN